MNEQPTFHSLTEDDLRQRDAFIADRRAKEARSRKLIVGVAFIALLVTIAGGFYAVKSHLAANALKMEQENQRAQAQATQEAAARAERDFQAAYAGRLESWETILSNRNPIKGWPVRRREAILNDIAAKESEIDGIRSQMRAANTQNNYTYSDSYGRSGSGTVNSYNAEQMTQLLQQLNRAEEELFLLQTELRRDDYFQGRISGYDL
jgi:hypothetical protein